MIVTIFRSRVKPEAEQEYSHWAERMSQLARDMPGYISHKGFMARDGERVTVVEFENEATLKEWARHPEHAEAKKKGRADFYAEYRTQICSVLRESAFPQRPAGQVLKAGA
jgi:heme-degrading monooxygenase HmoA